MNDYDHMTVDELFCEYAHWARNEAGTHWEIHGVYGVTVVDKNPLEAVGRKHAIIDAIRRKIIEEASVGTWIHACDFPDETVVYTKDDGSLPVGDYWLFPKDSVAWYGLLATPEELAYIKEKP